MAVELRSRSRHNRNKDQNNNKEPLKKKSKKAHELRELALQEIATLNHEICHLEEEIFQKESTCAGDYTLETLEKIGSDLVENNQPCSSKEYDRSEIERDIDALNTRVSSLEHFTGIRFVKNDVSVLSTTDNRTVLLRRMSGTCQRIPFTVEFEVKEDEHRESPISSDNKDSRHLEESTSVLTRLKVDVTHPLAKQELLNFLQTVEKENALQPFFIGLVQYADWHNNRQRTFQHFNTKYPETVQLIGAPTGSQSMQLKNRNKPGLVFTVYWRLDISDAGHVTPDFQIHASAPWKRTDQRDKNLLLRSVPRQFENILPILGVEQSIEVVIGMLCR